MDPEIEFSTKPFGRVSSAIFPSMYIQSFFSSSDQFDSIYK
jgi:hypothetical protein